MHSNSASYCRVCGYEPSEAPWGADGSTPSWGHCPCCGVEFGYQDATVFGVERFRELWLASGAPWSDRYTANDGLGVAERLARVSRDG